ncbi:zona pellucida sperm-binding protein 3-like isoform X1 [Clupea harengus]|uniref:Zona pellucida sperm-binding protein 3-like isoform X1 n=1 Tax=Clupea harengus TaxID=7950 RepID=A0A6P8EIN2_CLUHA|nr:zona pellucida sperm-binding protein 3-like isoform X1 [Clupea harengus]
MVLQLEVFLLVVASLCAVFAKHDIQIECGKGVVLVRLRVGPELSVNVSRILLGSCYATEFVPLPEGGGDLFFHYALTACHFKKMITEEAVVYKNTLAYRPESKPKPAALSFPVECAYKRKKAWTPAFLNPGFASAEGHSQLSFHMGLLNENLTGPAQSNSFPVGSFIPVWAYVEQHAHQPLVLLLDECVASNSIELEPTTKVYPIITNHGCLDDGKNGNSLFLPRYESSAVVLYLQAFSSSLEKVYIHCKLVAWDPNIFDEGKKMCNFNKEFGGWELLDDPSRSAVCSCCDRVCKHRARRDVDSEPQGLVQNAVLGPLIITKN